MNKVYLVFLLTGLLLFSCAKENDTPQAIKELIKNYSHCECDPFIDKYLWKGQEIYLSSCRGPACNCITLYYDKNGREFKMAEGYTNDDFRKDTKFLKSVWYCKN